MSRLKSRNAFPPGGFSFYEPTTQWSSTPWASFDTIVQEIIAHRQGNPALKAMATDYGTVAEQLDAFNSAKCEAMGWSAFLMDGGPSAPFTNSPPPPIDPSRLSAVAAEARAIWQGVRTLNDWIDSGEPAVPAELSAHRAEVCSTCPKNGKGDLASLFTKPAADAIRKQLEKVEGRKLSTPFDDKLNVCQTCWCPLRLKVHTPIVSINEHMSDEIRNALKAVVNPSGGCWIPKEIFA